MVNKGFKNNLRKFKGNIVFGKDFGKKESQTKKELYKKAINRCCMPGCRYGYDLNVHHIDPKRKGGTDTFDNYIVLCGYCHRHSKLHSRSEENRIALLVYKFMIEQDIFGIGISSDDYSDEEFQKLLRNYVYGYEHPVRTLKQEQENEDPVRTLKQEQEGKGEDKEKPKEYFERWGLERTEEKRKKKKEKKEEELLKEVLKIIKENQPISVYELMKKLNVCHKLITYSNIGDIVERLELKNKIKTKPMMYDLDKMIRIKEQENEQT